MAVSATTTRNQAYNAVVSQRVNKIARDDFTNEELSKFERSVFNIAASPLDSLTLQIK